MVDYYCDVTDNLSTLKKILADGGYTGENFANAIKILSGSDVEIVKRNELHTFAVLPRRWIVERSFAWIDKCRTLEKLRAQIAEFFSNVFSCLYSPPFEQILNRFLLNDHIGD